MSACGCAAWVALAAPSSTQKPHPAPAGLRRSAATPAPKPGSPTSPAGSTAGWRPYADPSRLYALQIPATWKVFGPCPVGQSQARDGTEVRFAPHDDTCGIDAVNDDIVVDVMPAASQSQVGAEAPACQVSRPVAVGGVAGTRVEHASPACGDYPAAWYQLRRAGRVFTFTFDSLSFCDFAMSPAPDPAPCGGTRGDFSSILDTLVTQTLIFGAAQ